jgi:6-phospho-3-hexuloisomerase
MKAIVAAKRVFVAGAGRSGLMMRAFAMRLMQIGIDTYVVGESTTPDVRKDDLLIIGSGSGRTGGPVSYAQIARHSGVPLAVITAANESPINDIATLIVKLPAPTPKLHEAQKLPPSVQPMGSLFEQTLLVYLDALIILLMIELNVPESVLYGRHTQLE